MSQGLDESSELLDKLSILWDNMDPEVTEFMKLDKVKDNSKLFELSNGSKMLVRTSFRSGTLQMLHVSEMGKIANSYPVRAKEVMTGSFQALAAGLPGIIESTAEGVNRFKDMWDKATNFSGSLSAKDFLPVFLPWTADPDCNSSNLEEESKEGADYFKGLSKEYGIEATQSQRNFWESQFRELGLDVYQEYPATPEEAFRAALEGAYYGSYVAKYITRGDNRIRDNLYVRGLPITVSADLGTDDEFVLLFWQYYSGEHRLIREYVNRDKITEHYVEIVRHYYPNDEIRNIILPHDAAKRDDNTHETRYDVFRKGFPKANVRKLKRTDSVINDIQKVRKAIPKIVLDSNCVYSLDCLLNYSKEWDDRREMWKPMPSHDKFSHGADAIRYYVVGNTSEDEWNKVYDRIGELRENSGGGFSF